MFRGRFARSAASRTRSAGALRRVPGAASDGSLDLCGPRGQRCGARARSVRALHSARASRPHGELVFSCGAVRARLEQLLRAYDRSRARAWWAEKTTNELTRTAPRRCAPKTTPRRAATPAKATPRRRARARAKMFDGSDREKRRVRLGGRAREGLSTREVLAKARAERAARADEKRRRDAAATLRRWARGRLVAKARRSSLRALFDKHVANRGGKPKCLRDASCFARRGVGPEHPVGRRAARSERRTSVARAGLGPLERRRGLRVARRAVRAARRDRGGAGARVLRVFSGAGTRRRRRVRRGERAWSASAESGRAPRGARACPTETTVAQVRRRPDRRGAPRRALRRRAPGCTHASRCLQDVVSLRAAARAGRAPKPSQRTPGEFRVRT